ncbi:MOT2 transcription factor [Handroanthus impetiginosus]|uniref:MOT2 transcription factor n=1 Tax=Handroanthus impetiginosus TaxID=429701 RepID=A0A2G9GI88_9LAMI|nr:MOT2 transcription factor [Handroanthus impetiginosus]
MISDSIPKASIAMASSNTKDFAKKKRANRSAKLKQYKLDARREQWLSRDMISMLPVKSKGGSKEEVTGRRDSRGGPELLVNERDIHIKKLEIKPRTGEDIFGDGSSMHHYSDSESSPSNSPSSHSSSVLGSNDSGVNFIASSRSSSCSNGCLSGSMSEEDERDVGDDGCLDDWEAMADALAATEDKQQDHSPNSGYGSPPSDKPGNSTHGSHLSVTDQRFLASDISNAKQDSGRTAVRRSLVHCQAWRPDDAFRPQSLPNLSQRYISERHFGRGGSVWGRKNCGPGPTSCPICCEDLDCTDSSFLPCSCGFRLCLFCHKRILEEDGRCPGCRKHYDCDFLRESQQWVEGA